MLCTYNAPPLFNVHCKPNFLHLLSPWKKKKHPLTDINVLLSKYTWKSLEDTEYMTVFSSD